MGISCTSNNGGLVTLSIKTGGEVIADSLSVYSVRVEKAINRISKANIVVLDGNTSTGTFEASSSETFVPGKEILIEAGYDTSKKMLFKGIITQQTIRIDEHIGSALEIECYDVAVKMIVGRKSLTFSKKTDGDIMSSVIEKYSGLSAEVTETSTEWAQQVQYYVTDWDFILSRAEANGLVVTTLNGKVTIGKPDAETTPVLTVTYGDNLLECNAKLSALTQFDTTKAVTWDYKTQELTSGETSNDHPGPGNISSKKLSEILGLSNYNLQTTVPLEKTDLTNWAKAQMIKSEYSKIQGEVKFQGNHLANPGKYLTIKGVGNRLNGNHLISGITHDISDGNWITEAKLGLSASWFTEEADIAAPLASGLLPGVQGLFNATVKKIYEDPEEQFRILVDVPLFDQNGEGIWARLTNFYSTSGAGVFFLPEVGDEVVLGFLNEDPRFPIILGSLYSGSKRKPFESLEPNEKNSLKAIVSKSRIMIQFDDEKKVFTIETPNKNKIICSDEDKEISIQDQNENSIIMSDNGIVMKSPKNITVQADQNLILKGAQGVKMEASTGDVEITGINIKETADSQYSAEGSESAQINSGMELTLKSAMIMIN